MKQHVERESQEQGVVQQNQTGANGLGYAAVLKYSHVMQLSSQWNTGNYKFTPASAKAAIAPIPRGEARRVTDVDRSSGVEVGDMGSYAAVQYVEQTGDQLTGDHQPSGAAVKEAIRLLLHQSLAQVLTRQQARNAYKKAITIVVTDKWHKKYSRTYGGRNTKAQIQEDAQDLASAAVEDWKLVVTHLKKEGFDDNEVKEIWSHLDDLRVKFFQTGKMQFQAVSDM